MNMPLGSQLLFLFVLAVPVACVSWTVTHEEVVREAREWCTDRSKECGRLYQRKFFYLFTCEYCFSHYVSLFFLWLAHFQLLLPGWRGYLVAWFALVWVANIYMGLFGMVRLGIKEEKVAVAVEEMSLGRKKNEVAFGRVGHGGREAR